MSRSTAMGGGGGAVGVHLRFGKDATAMLQVLTEEAIENAVYNTIADVADFALGSQSQVPVDTSRLISSFDISPLPRGLVFGWSAIKPGTSYDYAKIQDEGGGHISGNYFSIVTKNYARERLLYHLRNELLAIGTVP